MTYKEPRTFTLYDPRTIDGSPFDVAERAAGQIGGLVVIALDSLENAKLMIRNAELERQCQRDEKPDPLKWDQSAEGRQWEAIETALSAIEQRIRALQKAAAFDPRNPPKE